MNKPNEVYTDLELEALREKGVIRRQEEEIRDLKEAIRIITGYVTEMNFVLKKLKK